MTQVGLSEDEQGESSVHHGEGAKLHGSEPITGSHPAGSARDRRWRRPAAASAPAPGCCPGILAKIRDPANILMWFARSFIAAGSLAAFGRRSFPESPVCRAGPGSCNGLLQNSWVTEGGDRLWSAV